MIYAESSRMVDAKGPSHNLQNIEPQSTKRKLNRLTQRSPRKKAHDKLAPTFELDRRI